MGNFFTFFERAYEFSQNDTNTNSHKNITEDEDDTFDLSELDKYSKEDIIEFIKALKIKSLYINDNFAELIKNIELENDTLIPMCVELYKKLTVALKNVVLPVIKVSQKKIRYVRPKFTEDAVKKTLTDNVNTAPLTAIIDTTICNIPVSSTSFKTDDITIDEYEKSFNNTLLKKDMMGINKKILKLMTNYLKQRFVNTYNELLNDNINVKKMSLGRASYMYKEGKQGPTNDINSFRQIISIPNAVNQLHRILVIRLTNYLQQNKYVNTNIQKGGISGTKFAIFEQYYKLKNVLKNANKKKTSLALLFLDISNAFGNLSLPSLYKILEAYHVDKKFIDYLGEYYKNFEFYVDCGSIKTGTYKWNNGLVQGCALSPLLFVLALNYVLSHLDTLYKEEHGYTIISSHDPVGKKILFTAFIDDICIVGKNQTSVNFVYGKLQELLNQLNLPINQEKSALMIVNDPTPTPASLANIQKVNVFKYLGEYISNDGSYAESYTQFLKQISRRLISIDTKKITNEQRIKLFSEFLSPWIQRKTMAMYDLHKKNRLKIVSLIKPYLEKWQHPDIENVHIFSDVSMIIKDSTDDVIKNTIMEEDDDDTNFDDDMEIVKHVLKDTSIQLKYDEIDDDFEIDLD